MNSILTNNLDDIIKNGINEAAKTDAQLATAMKTKKMDDCVAAIYQAFYKIASDNRGGASACALQGQDELIVGAAIHWFTEANPTQESMVDILKGGTKVHAMKSPKKETKPNKANGANKAKETKTKAAPVAADDDFDVDGDDDPTPAPTPEPKAEPTSKPTATPQTLFADDDFDVD